MPVTSGTGRDGTVNREMCVGMPFCVQMCFNLVQRIRKCELDELWMDTYMEKYFSLMYLDKII